VIQNGVLTTLDVSITGNMTLGGASGVTLTTTGLALDYQASASGNGYSFEIDGGSVAVSVGAAGASNNLSVTGTIATPGLVIQNGVLTTLDVSITGNMTLGGASGVTLTRVWQG
jgi:hypothetical protein